MAKPKLLIVDDETDLLAELQPLLTRAGFEVFEANDGEQALKRMSEVRPDLVILDVVMPGMDGREVLRRLRQEDDWTPIILLTRVGSPAERAMSLQEGADDYINKPFDPMELVARVQAVLRRTKQGVSLVGATRLISEGLELDRRSRQAFLHEQPLALTARALGVLEFLMLHPLEIIARERLLDEVWGWAYPVQTRAVDIRIAEVRKALKDDPNQPRFIETVVGQGYRFLGAVEGRT